MRKQTILSIAIMAALPFGAHADPVGPAAVPANGTAVVATANAPYVTQTPTAADATHIASTAYVKGAYNDAIAAVNKVANTVDGKQAQLVNEDNNHAMYNKVLGSANLATHGRTSLALNDIDYVELKNLIAMNYSNGTLHNLDEILISTGGVLDIVREVGRELKYDTDNKRVEIYTTWENDNAKQQVAFVNAQ